MNKQGHLPRLKHIGPGVGGVRYGGPIIHRHLSQTLHHRPDVGFDVGFDARGRFMLYCLFRHSVILEISYGYHRTIL